jgi:DNA-binding HxlR family transcriptional regulator
MDGFRYAQHCPIARVAEIIGHRWNLPLLRELFLGPQRFSDLRRRLHGVSSSVLSERLRLLEAQGVVTQRALPPPAASSVYELTPLGQAFWPALREIVRWGLLFQTRDGPEEGDHFEPEWVRLAAACFAASGPTPARCVEIRVVPGSGRPDVAFRVEGGAEGTRVLAGEGPAEASLRGGPEALMAAMSGALDPTRAPDALSVAGDSEAVRALPRMFQIGSDVSGSSEPGAPPTPRGNP